MVSSAGAGRGGEEFSPSLLAFYKAVGDFGVDFAQTFDISNDRIRAIGKLQDKAKIKWKGVESDNLTITVFNIMRQNLAKQDETESILGSLRMAKARMANIGPIGISQSESALQQAGQQSTVSVVNQSNTQNISTASSSSNQANVGQTQQSIPISNRFGAAPRSV